MAGEACPGEGRRPRRPWLATFRTVQWFIPTCVGMTQKTAWRRIAGTSGTALLSRRKRPNGPVEPN